MSYESTKKPVRIPIPWMRRGTALGAGDAIKQATGAIGIQPCGGCQQRAARLNQRIVFVGRRK